MVHGQTIIKNRRNKRIEFMDLPKLVYGPLKGFYLRNQFEGAVYEKSNYIEMIESSNAPKVP